MPAPWSLGRRRCNLMGLVRSTYYDEPAGQPIDEARLIERIKEISAEWPNYGYRRVTAQLHAEGMIVNHKKVMWLMRENGLSVRPRRRFVATTDRHHDGPIFPTLAKDVVPTGPNQLWVADITNIAIAVGFVYLGGHSRRLVATCRGLCHRPTCRCPPGARGPSCGDCCATTAQELHPSLRSRLAIRCRGLPSRIEKHSLKGSIGRRGNPTTMPRPKAS